jgi:hypothetical protein
MKAILVSSMGIIGNFLLLFLAPRLGLPWWTVAVVASVVGFTTLAFVVNDESMDERRLRVCVVGRSVPDQALGVASGPDLR